MAIMRDDEMMARQADRRLKEYLENNLQNGVNEFLEESVRSGVLTPHESARAAIREVMRWLEMNK